MLSPLLVALGVAIKIGDGGPVFFASRRVGKGGRDFRLYKFRTMVVNAGKQGARVTSAGDERITPTGAWLRSFKLDELPQLWNVLKGDMSLVGPRPEDPHYVARYTPEQRRVLAVRPGITSVASLAYRQEEQLLTGPNWDDAYRKEILPAKLAMELAYLRRRTILSDVRTILLTIAALFKQDDA
jgi:lipopolysaccharide/colanic/teichoic acid biosynthesis glycosyltransferase